jgi:hypothetical protein
MYDAIKMVADYYGGKLPPFYTTSQSPNRWEAMMWKVWNKASDDMMYDDSHPWFQNGRWHRIVPHNPGFNLYLDPTLNDSHIGTAIYKIGKELGLTI